MYKILGQQVIWSATTTQETGVGYIVYTVPAGKCTTCTIYVTLAQGSSQSARNTSENAARYKLHINRAWTTWISDDYWRPSTDPYFDWTSPTYPTWTEEWTLSYYPRRDNETLPDKYDNVCLNDWDQIIFYNFQWRVVVQVFWLELPNDLDTVFRTMMMQLTTTAVSAKAFFDNHASTVKTDIICASCW